MNYKNFDELPLVLSVEQMAEVLGIGRNTAYNLVRSKQIRSIRIGHQYRVSKDALAEYLNH